MKIKFVKYVLWVFCVTMATTMPSDADRNNDINLNVEKIDHLGNTDILLENVNHVTGGAHRCGVKDVPNLRKVFLTNETVTCNDGSPAGYYLRKSYGSLIWIVFLEGGWFCFDTPSCHGRWMNMRHQMSSRYWPNVRKGTGILSWDPEENKYYFGANMVYIPYCSSDSWTGSSKGRGGEFSFMGSLIVEEVIQDLLSKGLNRTGKLILAGSSAGGTGVLMNLDRVASIMERHAPGVEVRGIADSGWFLNNRQFKPVECVEAHSCAPNEGVRQGIQLWKGRVAEGCRGTYSEDEQWNCYFGYNMYPTLKTPVFIVQYLFDEAQITANNVGPPVKKEQWQFIHGLGREIKQTLSNITSVFAPACLSHILLTKSDWSTVSINGITLPRAIHCWEMGSGKSNRCRERVSHNKRKSRLISGKFSKNGSDKPLGDAPRPEKANKRRRGKKKRKRGRRKNKRNRGRRETELKANKCSHYLIDTCAWPQCNFNCPHILNPFTGENMDFIDLLMQFGLDLSSIADALGMDMQTLQSMDHNLLMQLLAQQT